MKQFEGFHRKAVIIVPSDETYKERLKKAESDDLKEISINMIYDMKGKNNSRRLIKISLSFFFLFFY